MSQSKVTSFYVARKNTSKLGIKEPDLTTHTEGLEVGSLKSNIIARKNTKKKNVSVEYSKLTSQLEEFAKSTLSCNLATVVEENALAKSDRLDKKSNKSETSSAVKNAVELTKKKTAKTNCKVQKKESKSKDEADLSQPKVTSFYGKRNTTKKKIDKGGNKKVSNAAPTLSKENDTLSVQGESKHKTDGKFIEKSEIDESSSFDNISSQPTSREINIQSGPSEVPIKQLKCDETFAKSKYLQASKYSPIKSPSKTSSFPEESTRLLSLKLKGVGMMKEIANFKSVLEPSVSTSLAEDVMKSPKRHLANPNEGTPPKKKLPLTVEQIDLSSPSKLKMISPRKLFEEEKDSDLSSLKNQINNRNLSEEVLKNIATFKKSLNLIRNNKSNKFNVTSIVSTVPESDESQLTLPTAPAHERYSYLVEPNTSLILPKKYKLLLEMFRSMDTVVSILNNRKEKITFDKIKEGVQKTMNRTFSQNHLGQIVSVMPSAYKIKLEMCNYKKAYDPAYELIITPILKTEKGNIRTAKNVTMTPQDLTNRKNAFHSQLLNRVILRHKEFLNRLNFPPVPVEKLTRWHPQFKVDLVPDVEIAALPEIPGTKVQSASDLLKHFIKGSVAGKDKLVKALKSVADETTSANTIELKPVTTEEPKKSVLKGVCSDLIAKVRARESAKLLECMTEKPEETKRKAMLELLPKIVQILWHYFIAEKKAAVPIDAAIEKIIHSSCSLSTHEEVKAHLKLIPEVYPDWLFFIQIPKGLYIKINKNKNITEMLAGSGCL